MNPYNKCQFYYEKLLKLRLSTLSCDISETIDLHIFPWHNLGVISADVTWKKSTENIPKLCQFLINEWTFLQKFDSVTLPTLMYVHFNVRLAFVYSSGKCMSHKSRPMLQKNPNMARNSNSRNYYFSKQIIKFSWSWWLSHVTVPNPNQSTQRIVCLDSHVFLGPL